MLPLFVTGVRQSSAHRAAGLIRRSASGRDSVPSTQFSTCCRRIVFEDSDTRDRTLLPYLEVDCSHSTS